ncbi:MAG: hypothetical protein KBS43_00175 [Oscillospiraceae bacterium]|nr:hypothetical protein [Candidatus Limimonas coprohippi]
MTTQTAVNPADFLDQYTGIWVPVLFLGLALVALMVMQVIFTMKTDSILLWIIPLFLGVAGGFSSLATMSYYSSFETIANNNLGYLTAEQQAMCPDFGAYSVTFLALAVFFFASLFISFVLAIIKAIRRRNQY